MRKYKEFVNKLEILAEASVWDKKYIDQVLALNPTQSATFLEKLKDMGITPTDFLFKIHSKEGFESEVREAEGDSLYEITFSSGKLETVYTSCKIEGGRAYIKLNASRSFYKAFYGSRGGTNKKAGGLSGKQGEVFWEWCSYLALIGKEIPKKSTEVSKKVVDAMSINLEDLQSVIDVNFDIMQGIHSWTTQLLADLNKGKPDFIFARSVYGEAVKDVETYYSYTKGSKISRPKQKDNTADAVWVWKEDFTKKPIDVLTFAPQKNGLVDVLEGDKIISTFLQASQKKGKKLAQGGGLADGLKAKNWYDSDMRKRVLSQISPESISIEKTTPEKMFGVIQGEDLDEGVIDFIKSTFKKVKQMVVSFMSGFGKAVGKISKMVNGSYGKKMAESIEKQIGLTLLEASDDISYDFTKFQELFNKAYTSVKSMTQNNENYYLMESGKPQGPTQNMDMESAKNLVVNIVGMTIVYNTLKGLGERNTEAIIKELRNMVYDIKMGDTLLPVFQIYGDGKYEIYERDDEEKLEKVRNDLKMFENYKVRPIVCEIRQSGGTGWNVIHMFLMKEFNVSESPKEGEPNAIPEYNRLVLRMDNFRPKLVSNNQTFSPVWSGGKFNYDNMK